MNPSNLRIAWKDGLRSLIQKAVGRRVCLTAKWRLHRQASRKAEDLERMVGERTRELQQSEERFRQVAESAGEWIWEVDAEGVYRYCSSAVEAMLGYTPEELVGKKHFYDLFVPEAREKQKADAMAAFAQRASFRKLVNANLHKNGRTVIAETSGSPVLDEQRHFLGYRGTDADITERKQAEELLRGTNQILDEILRAITVRVFWKDHNLRYLGCNPVFAGDAGFSNPGDIVGKDDFQMAWRDQAELYRADDRSVIASGRSRLLIEEPQTTPAGDTIWLLTNKVPLRDSTGEIRGVLGTYMDVTEQKRAQAEREEMEKQLQAKLKLASVGTLACGMGHEINNPIMGIINYAQLIKDRLQGKDEALEDFAGEIMIEAERISGIVRGLSAFATRDIVTRAAVPVSDLIESAISATRATLTRDHITLAVEVPADLPAVSCDRRQIEQVLTGLLANACDALNEKYPGYDVNKKVVISATKVTMSLVKGDLSLTEPNNQSPITDNADRRIRAVRLTVEDHGTGVPDAVREHIFEPFFTTKDKSVGAGNIGKGLGLFVSYATLQEHGGVLSVESAVGQWTRFDVDLPVGGISER